MDKPVSRFVIDSIIRSGRKSVALVVTADAKLIVRAPYRTSVRYIEDLVRQKQKWIAEKQQAAMLRNEAHKVKQVVEGEEFLFLGELYRLELRAGKPLVELQPGKLLLQAKTAEDAEPLLEAWYRKHARRVLAERTAYYSKLTGLRPKSISITGARRRWGSCGPKNSLNFTWRLVMAPLDVIDYVAVHELAHIEFKNHSANFWNSVASILPEYKKCRKWLADNQRLMELL